jgi:hypothetical protein
MDKAAEVARKRTDELNKENKEERRSKEKASPTQAKSRNPRLKWW